MDTTTAQLVYDTENKLISQVNFDRNLTAKTESIFSQGNGYLGLRAVDEEIESFNKEDFFVNGIFNLADPSEVSELVNLADCLQTKIMFDGKVFSLASGVKSYLKTLYLNNGLLERKIVYEQGDKEFELCFKRIVDQVKTNFYAQEILIKQVRGESTKITLFPMINGQTTNRGLQHTKEGIKVLVEPNVIQYQEETTQSKRLVVHTMIIKAYENSQLLSSGSDDYVIKMARRQIGFQIQAKVAVDKPFLIEKMMIVNTPLDSSKKILSSTQVLNLAKRNLAQAKKFDFESILNSNDFAYDNIYDRFYLKIEGNSNEATYDRLAFLFSLYHANNFVPRNNSWVSIGAKGMSGEGYQGHCYWDTEFFVVPNYMFTQSKIARNLLEYRYRGLNGARIKAKEGNYIGAQYPWEAAWSEDGEVTPYWGQPDIVTGKQVPIASRQQEIHVAADIAVCVDQYFQATNDVKFMNEMGYEMIIDTAIFWSSRAEWRNNQYEITNVMGPNEYKGNINNNHYTNLAAKYNLKLALRYIQELKKTVEGNQILIEIINRLPYKLDINKLWHVHDNLKQQFPNNEKIITENDQFLSLPKMNIKPFQFLGDAGKTLFNTTEGIKRLSCQLVKQADVVLSLFVFPEFFSRELVRTNFDYYEPLTTHDSSLSASTFSIIANDLRKRDQAYQLYRYAQEIDMGPNFHSCNAGIHAGSLTAIWQMIVFGFGGFRFWNDQIHFNPCIPDKWDNLEYKVIVKKTTILVKVNHEKFFLQLLSGQKLDVYVNKELFTIKRIPTEFEVQKQWLKD